MLREKLIFSDFADFFGGGGGVGSRGTGIADNSNIILGNALYTRYVRYRTVHVRSALPIVVTNPQKFVRSAVLRIWIRDGGKTRIRYGGKIRIRDEAPR